MITGCCKALLDVDLLRQLVIRLVVARLKIAPKTWLILIFLPSLGSYPSDDVHYINAALHNFVQMTRLNEELSFALSWSDGHLGGLRQTWPQLYYAAPLTTALANNFLLVKPITWLYVCEAQSHFTTFPSVYHCTVLPNYFILSISSLLCMTDQDACHPCS